MGTGVCLFLDWKNGIWVTGLGMTDTKMEMGKPVCHYKDSCS